MKKVWRSMLAALLAGTLLAGCGTGGGTKSSSDPAGQAGKEPEASAPPAEQNGGDEAPADKVSLSYCYWGAESEAKVRKGAAELFNASQDKIVVNPVFVDSANYMAKLQAYFAAGNAPDVIQSSGNFGDTYINRGMMEDLTPYVQRDGLQGTWNQLLVDNYTYDGKLYALPMIFNSFYIIYNKDLFDAAGLAYPTNDWTEEEFLADAKALTKGEGADKIYGIRLSWLPPTMLPEIYGEPVFDIPNKKMHFADNQAFIDGFQYLTDLALVHGVAPDAAGEKAAGAGFVSGKFGMEISALWDMEQIGKTVGDSFAYDIVKFPVNAKYGRWRTPIANVGFYIFSGSTCKEEAWQFIKYASTDPVVQDTMNLVGIPAAKSITEKPDFLTTFPEGWKSFDKTVVQDMEDAVIWPTDVGVWGKMVTEIQAQYDKVMNRECTVQEAAQSLQKTGDAALAKEG